MAIVATNLEDVAAVSYHFKGKTPPLVINFVDKIHVYDDGSHEVIGTNDRIYMVERFLYSVITRRK